MNNIYGGMMKQCKVILTTECNLKCSYCCNKLPEIQQRVKIKTFDELVKTKYDVYNLTGGEIGLSERKTRSFVTQLKKFNPECKIYLYTNGTHSGIITDVDGINVGYHEENKNTVIQKCILYKEMGHKVRLHIEDKVFNDMDIYTKGALKYNFDLKLWTRNECNINDNDDWFII